MKHLGLVAIGRNEGKRLRQCLQSVVGKVEKIVYVDSGSTDGSVDLARSLGAEVVILDLSLSFTAARARNEGFRRLLQLDANLEFVQFVDGDCEIVDGWLKQALDYLQQHSQVAVVCGRRRERYRDRSIFNRLCDLEWDTPVGEAKACGGDAMMRLSAFVQVEGYNSNIIAGEEPELCVRLRQQNWKIWRLDVEMTRHDAQITQFRQWWQRNVRSGHAYAEGAWLHGKPPERHSVKESRSIWFWGGILPVIAVGLAVFTSGLSFVLLLGYPLLGWRIYRYQRQRGREEKEALFYSLFCLLGKFPQFQGQLTFLMRRLLGKRTQLIEYKSATVN